MNIQEILADLGIKDHNPGVMIGAKSFGSGANIESHSPVDGKRIASLSSATADDYEQVMTAASEAFVEWRKMDSSIAWRGGSPIWRRLACQKRKLRGFGLL